MRDARVAAGPAGRCAEGCAARGLCPGRCSRRGGGSVLPLPPALPGSGCALLLLPCVRTAAPLLTATTAKRCSFFFFFFFFPKYDRAAFPHCERVFCCCCCVFRFEIYFAYDFFFFSQRRYLTRSVASLRSKMIFLVFALGR